jgi:hypothetical protein
MVSKETRFFFLFDRIYQRIFILHFKKNSPYLVPFEYANHFEEPIDKQHPIKTEFYLMRHQKTNIPLMNYDYMDYGIQYNNVLLFVLWKEMPCNMF